MTQPPVDYQSKSTKKPGEIGSLGAPQAVFDTVIGPNLRLKDNLIQLIACVIGGILGATTAGFLDTFAPITLVIGGLIGIIVFGFLAGAYIGIHRFITRNKKR